VRERASPKFRRLAADERRQTLVLATLDSLARHGPHGAGVREICARAHVSPGLLRHYFDGKDALIREAFRTLTREFRGDLRRVLRDRRLSASARVEALVDTYLSSQLSDDDRASTYLAFWALARTDPTLRRVQRAAYRELQRQIRPALVPLMRARQSAADEREVTVGLIALLDGLWLEISVDPTAMSRAQACTIALRWLDARLASPRSRRRATSSRRSGHKTRR